MYKTVAVYDDFLRRPGQFRDEARRIRFVERANIESNIVSTRSRHARAVCAEVAKLVGAKVSWDWRGGSGTYRRTTAAEVARKKTQTVVHSDGGFNLVALLYLSRPEECHGGTGLFRHKKSRLHGVHDLLEVRRAATRLDLPVSRLIDLFLRDSRDASKWEMTDLVEMKYNRLVVFNSNIFHSHVFDFARVARGAVRLTFAAYGACAARHWQVA